MVNVVLSWLTFFKKFPKAERYIFGLEFANDLAGKNFVDILIDFLRDDLNIKLPAAAKMVNVQEGVSSILGLVLFCIIPYYVLLDLIRKESDVQPLYPNRSNEDKILFAALFFLAVGISGRDFLLESFLSDQRLIKPGDPIVEEDRENRVSWSWRPYVKLLLSGVVSLLVGKVVQWILILIVAVIGHLCFLCGHSLYKRRPVSGGPLTTIFRVLKAAILRTNLKYPTKPSQSQFNKNVERANNNVLVDSIPPFRSLDGAAINLESTSSISKEQLETNIDKLCTVAQVKEVKRLLTMIPMWASFLVYSVVEAAGSTFFFEQTSFRDNDRFLVFFVICKDLASLISSDMGKILPDLQFLKTRQRLATLVRIGIGMLSSLLCCIVARRVEKITMNTKNTLCGLWLIPQFLLLGCMEGFAEKGASEFFKTQVSGSMRDYGPAFNEFVLGIGKFIGAILVVIFKKWFGKDLESSHLGSYYEFLAWLSLLDCFIFVSIAVWYYYDNYQQEEMENLLPTSIILPNKSLSFPEQGSTRLPRVRRFLTAIDYEKAV